MNTTSIRDLLEKQGRRIGSTVTPLAPAAEPKAEYEPFASGRIGNKPQLTLVFRKANGTVRGFSYSFFYSVESDDPADGFTIDFTHDKLEVVGRNLKRLFHLVCEHRAAEIVEAGRNELLQTPENDPVVEQIDFRKP